MRLPRVCLGSFWECGARGGTRTRLGRICACFHRRLTLPSLVPSHVHGIRHGTGSSLVDVGSQRTDGRRLCAIDPRGAPSCRPSQQFRAFSMALVDVAFLPGLEQDGTCTCPRALALPWTDSWIPSRLFPSFPTWRPRSDGDHPARSFPIRPWNRDVAHRPGQLPCTSKERRRHVDVPLSSMNSDKSVGGRGSLFLSCPSKERERTEPLGIESSFLRVDERKGSGPPRARRRWRTKGRWKTCGWKHTKWRAVRPC